VNSSISVHSRSREGVTNTLPMVIDDDKLLCKLWIVLVRPQDRMQQSGFANRGCFLFRFPSLDESPIAHLLLLSVRLKNLRLECIFRP